MKITTGISVLLVSSAFSDVQAFVPISPGTPTQFRTASPPLAIPRSSMTSTSLGMKGNLVDRFIRVFNANVNKLVSGLEDPEKVIVQAVEDMQVG